MRVGERRGSFSAAGYVRVGVSVAVCMAVRTGEIRLSTRGRRGEGRGLDREEAGGGRGNDCRGQAGIDGDR